MKSTIFGEYEQASSQDFILGWIRFHELRNIRKTNTYVGWIRKKKKKRLL